MSERKSYRQDVVKLPIDTCEILHLVLKRKWYEMIASGEKTEEYRALTPYWASRLNNWSNSIAQAGIGFSLGYRKPDLFRISGHRMLYKVRFGARHPEWGEPEEPHFVIPIWYVLKLTKPRFGGAE